MVPRILNAFTLEKRGVMNWFYLRDYPIFGGLMPESVFRVQNNFPVSHLLHLTTVNNRNQWRYHRYAFLCGLHPVNVVTSNQCPIKG